MITSTTRTAGPFLGNGSTTVFSFGFKVFLTSEVLVQQTDVSGNVTTLALTSQYTVSLNSNQDTNPGGTVTLLTALTASYLLVITSQIALIQSANLTNAGNFYPQVVNDALDRLTIIAQQQANAQSRSLTVPLTDSSSIALQLPSASSRALKFLAFDSSGSPIAAAGSAGTPTSSFMAGVNTAIDQPTALNTLLPSQTGNSGKVLSTNGTVAQWLATPTLAWNAVKTAAFTGVASNGYPINTTSAAITVTLPATAANGDTIILTDYLGTFKTNNLTINPNGLKINGSTSNIIVNTAGASVTLVYIDATQGWLAVSGFQNSPIGSYSANYLIVGGGGGGGGVGGGGGGAGGVIATSGVFTPGTAYTITVGAGGAGGLAGAPYIGTAGSSSSISGVNTALGGGYGGGNLSAGGSGGSGGGGGGYTAAAAGGSGTGGQGYAGGTSAPSGTYAAGGGGGGGAAIGSSGASSVAGTGGLGVSSSISGSATYYGGGGGGGAQNGGTPAAGGNGGGGAGTASASTAGVSGTANSGGGGGGGSQSGVGGNGGSGVVIIAYLGTQRATGGTVTSSGGYTIHTFLSSGVYVA